MADGSEVPRGMPLSTLLVPIVLIGVLAVVLVMGRPAPTPAAPPGIRTPEGTPSMPNTSDPESATTPTAGTPNTPAVSANDLPIYPGAVAVASTPFQRYRVKAPFADVRDYYFGVMGDNPQYAETTRDNGHWRRAVITEAAGNLTVQITAVGDSEELELAIGPLKAVSKGTAANGDGR
ncbi:MAG TPA: hypothetical protein VEI97_03445 [bacterium]|nr:hypothetical protein [bacterium]